MVLSPCRSLLSCFRTHRNHSSLVWRSGLLFFLSFEQKLCFESPLLLKTMTVNEEVSETEAGKETVSLILSLNFIREWKWRNRRKRQKEDIKKSLLMVILIWLSFESPETKESHSGEGQEVALLDFCLMLSMSLFCPRFSSTLFPACLFASLLPLTERVCFSYFSDEEGRFLQEGVYRVNPKRVFLSLHFQVRRSNEETRSKGWWKKRQEMRLHLESVWCKTRKKRSGIIN